MTIRISPAVSRPPVMQSVHKLSPALLLGGLFKSLLHFLAFEAQHLHGKSLQSDFVTIIYNYPNLMLYLRYHKSHLNQERHGSLTRLSLCKAFCWPTALQTETRPCYTPGRCSQNRQPGLGPVLSRQGQRSSCPTFEERLHLPSSDPSTSSTQVEWNSQHRHTDCGRDRKSVV